MEISQGVSLKIRIFALAKELGLDSKDLIQTCNDAGLHVKSSPLASISPEERDMVLAFMKKGGSAGKSDEGSGPSRDFTMERAGKTREMRTIAPTVRRRDDEIDDNSAATVDEQEDLVTTSKVAVAPAALTETFPATTARVEKPARVAPPKAEKLVPPTPVAPVAEAELERPTRTERSGPMLTINSRPPRTTNVKTEPMRPVSRPVAPGIVRPPRIAPAVPAAEIPVVSPEIRLVPAVVPPVGPVAKKATPVKPTAIGDPGKALGVAPEAPKPIVAEERHASHPENGSATIAEPALEEAGSDSTSGPARGEPGHRGLAGIRDMRAQGTIRDPGQARSGSPRREPKEPREEGGRPERVDSRQQDKKSRGPALPNIVLPNFKQPTLGIVKKSDGPVQKPDLKITREQLQKNRLGQIMQQHKEEPRPKSKVGVVGTAAEEEARARGRTGLNLIDAREDRRKKRKTRTSKDEEGDALEILRGTKRHRKIAPVERKRSAQVTLPITVRSLSEQLGRPAKDIIGVLMRAGKMAKINDALDSDQALEIAVDLGLDCEIERPKTVADTLAEWRNRPDEDFGVPLEPRAPIITILGHVDHGKTTLVDRIRSANVAAGEAGGITQHIAAYQVDYKGRKLTFVDTPGHAAFGEMRARGANVTDIVVLVVAANDGVMPQTEECISHTRAAEVPLVVAMNKMDLPSINQQKVLTDLSNHGVLPSEWGGDTEVVRVSGLTGEGVDNLLETLLLTADLHELRAPVDCPADGVCLEAFRDEGRGPIAWIVVRRGTLKVGNVLVCGNAYGRIRAMYNDRGEAIETAPPSTPCKVAGLNIVPNSGEHFFVLETIEQAREVAEQRKEKGRDDALALKGGVRRLEDFFTSQETASVRELPLVVKADSPGSIEALRHELGKLQHAEVRIKILHEGVGGVNESDVYLASSAGAIIIAFHVIPEDRAAALASQEGVDVRRYNIIYNITDEIRLALEGLLAPERVEVATGRAIVLRTFSISRMGTVAGCRVLNGTIERSNRMHVIRDQKVLNDYHIASLKREKDDVRDVRDGLECGIRLEGFNDIKEGDILEGFKIEERKRILEI